MDHGTGHVYSESFFPFWSLLLRVVLQHKRTVWFTYGFPYLKNNNTQSCAPSWGCSQCSARPQRRNADEIRRCFLRSSWQHWQSILLSGKESSVCVLCTSVANAGVGLCSLTRASNSSMNMGTLLLGVVPTWGHSVFLEDFFKKAFYVLYGELRWSVNCCLRVRLLGNF